MRISLEMYILINLCMNFITIGSIARARGRVRWGTVVFASAFGALYAVAMQTSAYHQLQSWPLRLLLGLLLVACSMRVDSLRDLADAFGTLLCGTLLLGGVQMAIQRMAGSPATLATLLTVPVGAAVLTAVLSARKQRLRRLEVQMMLRSGPGRLRLTALVDTGNRLHEPLSGLPVLIVCERDIRRLLPLFDAESAMRRLPPGFRMVGYGALGGGGQMVVFRPDELLMNDGDGWMRAPDVWVGVYPGELPGRVQALAPGEIGYARPRRAERASEHSKILQTRGRIP